MKNSCWPQNIKISLYANSIKVYLEQDIRTKSDTESIKVDVTWIHLVLKDLLTSLLTDKWGKNSMNWKHFVWEQFIFMHKL